MIHVEVGSGADAGSANGRATGLTAMPSRHRGLGHRCRREQRAGHRVIVDRHRPDQRGNAARVDVHAHVGGGEEGVVIDARSMMSSCLSMDAPSESGRRPCGRSRPTFGRARVDGQGPLVQVCRDRMNIRRPAGNAWLTRLSVTQ